jgi:hypothetical protein
MEILNSEDTTAGNRENEEDIGSGLHKITTLEFIFGCLVSFRNQTILAGTAIER